MRTVFPKIYPKIEDGYTRDQIGVEQHHWRVDMIDYAVSELGVSRDAAGIMLAIHCADLSVEVNNYD